MSPSGLQYLGNPSPRIMVVDGSRLVRMMIGQLLQEELAQVEVVSCGSGAEAKAALHRGPIDLVSTALRLPDMDGLELARYVREQTPQAYIPIIVVSGDVQERLEQRSISDAVTDYFDKGLGFKALATFIRGYIHPEAEVGGEVLYVEDSRVVAIATRRMLEKHGLIVTHAASVEDALVLVDEARAQGRSLAWDVVLTDVYLKGELSGRDLLLKLRHDYQYSKGELPVLVMTGDASPANQSDLLRAGANDLVQKPIEERLLVTKLLFQLRVGRMLRAKLRPVAGA